MRALFLLLTLLFTAPAWAQQVTCATRPAGDKSNACASTAFVNNNGAGYITGLPLIGAPSGGITQGTRSGSTTTYATAIGTLSNGHCVSIDVNGNFIDAGGACTTGGGGGTVNAGNQGQLGYYTTAGTTISGGPLSIAANNTALSALSSGSNAQVLRLGYTTQGDAPPQIYKSSGAPCSLNSGAGDGGSQVPSSDSKCWLAVWDATGADIREFGAVDLSGATDYSTAWQNAINAAVSTGVVVNCPTGKFKINTPLNAINTNGVFIRGALGQLPSFGLVTAPPSTGCVLLGNTNAEVIDALGANSFHMSEVAISSIGQSTPSKIGLIIGASTGVQTGAPGGSDIQLTNVVVNLPYGINSVPIAYLVGAGLSTFNNVSVSGDYGFYLSSNNVLGIVPTYGTVAVGGSTGGVDAFRCYGCTSLSKGGGYAIYVEGSSDIRFSRFYTAQISGLNGSYAGVQFPVYVNNVNDIDIEIEDDYWPSVLYTTGTVSGLRLTGLIFSGTTALLGTYPYIALFNGAVIDSRFDIVPSGGFPTGVHYWYTTGTNVPLIQNNWFTFNGGYSTNIAYMNSSNYTFNNKFDGNTDAVLITFLFNGVGATPSQYRYFLNGIRQGTL